MRTLVYEAIVSADGYFEDADGKFDFAFPGPELHAHVNAQQAAFDTYVFGRRMYDVMRFWDECDPDTMPPVEAEFARIWQTKEKFVASRTLDQVGPGVTLIDGDAVEFVAALKNKPGRKISIGGACIARPMIAAGLVDEFVLHVLPVVVGGGKPFWPEGLDHTSLDLVDCTTLDGDTVSLTYRRQPD